MTGPGDNILVSWAADLDDLEGQIETLQDAKRDLYATVREEHGRVVADALKNSLRILRMDSEKRARVEEVDAETEKLLAAIEASRVRGAGAPHARPRAHVETIEEFTHPVANVGEEANGAEAAVSDDPASREVDDADRQQLAASGFTGEAAVASQTSHPDATEEPGTEAPAAQLTEPEPIARYDPATHFENSKGLLRLHGCQRPELCGSEQPRVRRCFQCQQAYADAEGFAS